MPIIYILLMALLTAAFLLPYRSAIFGTVAMLSAETVRDNSTLTSIYQKPTTKPPSTPTEPEVSSPAEEPEPPVQKIPLKDVQVPNYNTQYGQLSCDRLEIDCPLFFGDSKAALKKGAGQYIGSYLPGFNGTILVAAHNTTFFRPLEYVEIGDVFTVDTNYGTFYYQVYETKVLDHNDPDAFSLRTREKEILLLYTCYPFERMAAVKTDRLFVYCEKLSGPEIEFPEE